MHSDSLDQTYLRCIDAILCSIILDKHILSRATLHSCLLKKLPVVRIKVHAVSFRHF